MHLEVEGVVLEPVGARQDHAHDPHHVVGGKEAIGAHVGLDRGLEAQEPALGVDRRLDGDRLFAGMQRGHQVLEAVLAPMHRPAEPSGQRRRHQLLAQQCYLLPEAAADIGRDDGDLRLAQLKAAGQRRAQRVWCLVADMHRQVLGAGIEAADEAAGLDRQMRLAVLGEACLDDPCRPAKGALRVAGREALLSDAVARHGFIDQGGTRCCGGCHRRDGRQGLVVDLDQLGRVLGDVAVSGDHDRHGVADEADLVHGQRRHLGRPDAGDGRCHAQHRRVLGEVGAGQHGHHAGQCSRRRGVDRADAGVGVRAPDEADGERVLDRQVVEIAALAQEEAAILLARHRPAEGMALAHPSPLCRRDWASWTAAMMF